MTPHKPILFSTPMVQAILDGRKTMTRRVVKYPCKQIVGRIIVQEGKPHIDYCPYGNVGDLLWVRESFALNYFEFGEHGYKADWGSATAEVIPTPKWKPSIHMPKAAARIWLKIEEIRVERLQDISEEDAVSEGVEFEGKQPWYKDYIRKLDFFPFANPFYSFKSLWKSINGKESWDANPWVWVIKFSRTE